MFVKCHDLSEKSLILKKGHDLSEFKDDTDLPMTKIQNLRL